MGPQDPSNEKDPKIPNISQNQKIKTIQKMYSVSSLVVPKMEEGISGTGAVKNSK